MKYAILSSTYKVVDFAEDANEAKEKANLKIGNRAIQTSRDLKVGDRVSRLEAKTSTYYENSGSSIF